VYNFKDFDAQFPDDAACLEFIFKARERIVKRSFWPTIFCKTRGKIYNELDENKLK
jgi:hypothetical protein